jgi:hypothetical protein
MIVVCVCVWGGGGQNSVQSLYVRSEAGCLVQVYKKNNVYCKRRVVSGQTVFAPLDSQPSRDSVLNIYRYYFTSEIAIEGLVQSSKDGPELTTRKA